MNSIGTILLGAHWLVPVGIFVFVAFVGVRWLGKHLADQPDQIKRLLTNFGFCAAIATALAALTGHLHFDFVLYGVFGVGVLNGLANIQVWRATRMSLSKTSLLAFGDDIIFVLLSMVVIGDGRYLNGYGITGLILCFVAGILFWWHDANKKLQSRVCSTAKWSSIACCGASQCSWSATAPTASCQSSSFSSAGTLARSPSW